jgi:hypothetical protein
VARQISLDDSDFFDFLISEVVTAGLPIGLDTFATLFDHFLQQGEDLLIVDLFAARRLTLIVDVCRKVTVLDCSVDEPTSWRF